MTAFANKYLVPVIVMVAGTITIAGLTWLVNIHDSYATSGEVAQAVEYIDKKQTANRKRDLLQDNARDLKTVRYQIFQQRKHNPDDDAEALQYEQLEQEATDLEAEKVCIQDSGEGCSQ